MFWHRRQRSVKFKYVDIFEKTIADQRTTSTDLFRALEVGRSIPRSDANRPVSRPRLQSTHDLQDDIKAIGLIRDISEELHIMMAITKLQYNSIKGLNYRFRWDQYFNPELTEFQEHLKVLSEQATAINELVSTK